ncbi:RNA polymerase II subunit A C-terminal domain phosphatase [Caerostris darwini]|uniref:RNA polymerase II subunit A C-terminal domain phosphatase n=1 Tax=Caerostris darwini TaxID=1538125 RepID=A0AAV4W6F6_9ARAC|nr:RNA polymerase II subunit A C-terminal domain phosphatase [Caerostris darwini]
MASEEQTYCYDGTKSFTLVKWKIRKDSQLFYNSVILSYKQENGSSADGKEPLLKYKSNVVGTVSELIASEGDVVQAGAPLLKVQPCTHQVIMKDLCAECGTDLRHLDRDNFEKLTAATTYSMVHVVPELKVSLEQAEKLGQDDENRLLKSKKLVLLVDLDQTLIHTTNDNIPENLPNVEHFQLYGQYSPWYHTNLRPGTRNFLENISKHYELHICTFGARLYAHKIAQILDPDGKIFSHRILSRDECFDATSKTANLKGLFPRGDNMVCIIDDREDVWNFAPNVIHVKPYSYFRNTGDINAPPPPPPPEEEQPKKPTTTTADTTVENSNEKPNILSESSKELVEDKKQNGVINSDKAHENKSSTKDISTDPKPVEENPKSDSNISNEEKSSKSTQTTKKTLPPIDISVFCNTNADDYLLYLEEILINIHKTYYEMFEKMKRAGEKGIPNMKVVVPYVRSKILKGVNMVFSSIIPTNCVPESHHLWTLAESLGAHVTRDLNLQKSKHRTTHVIASKPDTSKVNEAKKFKGIHVVTLDWLLCCAERWERPDERLFKLKKNGESSIAEIEKSDYSYYDSAAVKSRSKRQRCSKKKDITKDELETEKMFSERLFAEAGLSLSKEDIEDMDREIDAACSEESDNDLEKSSSSDSSSSPESLSSGDYPRGWKRQKKCDDEDMEQEVASSGSSDADTIGSVDEEIAEAVKQEFGNY